MQVAVAVLLLLFLLTALRTERVPLLVGAASELAEAVEVAVITAITLCGSAAPASLAGAARARQMQPAYALSPLLRGGGVVAAADATVGLRSGGYGYRH